MTRANDVLNTCRRVVVVGASPDPKRYGHEVLEAFHAAGYDVAAVNPKYESIAGLPCFPSLSAVPAGTDVAVLVLSPENAARVIPDVGAAGIKIVWLPPGTACDATVSAARAATLTVVDDICPVATLRRRPHLPHAERVSST